MKKKGLKFLDLFAGVGGVRLGMEQAGHSCVGWVEWDKFARKSYIAIHKPDGEFTEKDINDVASQELPKADCWCFGFPCQDISLAGKQGGFTNGKRSSLFFKATGLIKELKEEDKPSYLFIENVKNLLSINKGWDFAKLLIEMDEIGYDCEWDVLDSAEVVPQHRERVYIVGHLRGRRTRQVFPITGEDRSVDSESSKINVAGSYRPDTYHGHGERYKVFADGLMPTLQATDYKQPKAIAVNQIGNIMDTKYFNGNPQPGRVYSTNGLAPTLSTMQGGGREPKIAIPVLTPDRLNKRQNGRRFKTNGEPMFTLDTQDRHGVLIKNATAKGYQEAVSGDGINLSQAESKTQRGRVQPQRAHTLMTNGSEGVLNNDMRIRKLTPRECWRLQTFPDYLFDRAQKVNSNSQLYKQAGNSVTCEVVHRIAEKMEVTHENE
ncbi:DNA (cytosine-5-)-methyltransferase [Furfurilactobacillus milii]|uniref:DNA (cytosine-5-)-methyltransferase n=1 Tax=Furfurilactobacillus milii TaxID=2888272 RepID=A0ABT6DCL6_9LACO|nr:DNA (cytosine-5-)-methyltransferase [Furfurilactobacillus milii]QLE66947.1 methyltransferase [Furfurilactobacillus rossiae]MCF6161957.1 DNA cytosine methyltransferase [Furfurilactobacillus milii]MCF6164337.1 DNA cytosine methyltransferase [Furfurilactobacillus milii]MDF9914825.1 DNA cytosine methyltransferase [Furfurilactobacillus milii]QLE69377.1 methyltransferase [Furfurilactobacillus rossiae]